MTKELIEGGVKEIEELLSVTTHQVRWNAGVLIRRLKSCEALTVDSSRGDFNDALSSLNDMRTEIAKIEENLKASIELLKRSGR